MASSYKRCHGGNKFNSPKTTADVFVYDSHRRNVTLALCCFAVVRSVTATWQTLAILSCNNVAQPYRETKSPLELHTLYKSRKQTRTTFLFCNPLSQLQCPCCENVPIFFFYFELFDWPYAFDLQYSLLKLNYLQKYKLCNHQSREAKFTSGTSCLRELRNELAD